MKILPFKVHGGLSEYHISEDFKIFDIEALRAFLTRMEQLVGGEAKPLFGRFFVSDYITLAPALTKLLPSPYSTFSIIEQPPLDGSALSLWIYYSEAGNSHNGYEHFWNVFRPDAEGDKTSEMFADYSAFLSANNCTLARDCIRTWFFVDDIDTNYASFVKKRKEFFNGASLTEKTHYLASTGIYGRSSSIVSMDAYAIKGVDDGQIVFLKGSSHLSSTIKYGVTFERGTCVKYGDRKHVFISGTASIDENGNVLYIGDALSQTKRLFENINVLLTEAGSSLSDMKMMIVYLRNDSDYEVVHRYISERFQDIPSVFVNAPVCRPQWLVEVECIAATQCSSPSFRSF